MAALRQALSRQEGMQAGVRQAWGQPDSSTSKPALSTHKAASPCQQLERTLLPRQRRGGGVGEAAGAQVV